mgnify:CR=1 FL=1
MDNIQKNSSKIPLYDKVIYSISAGYSSNLAVYIFAYYLTYFLVDLRGIPSAIAAAVILGSRIFDTATDFIIGILIDRVNFKSGKFRGWIKLGMIPMLIGLPLLFAPIAEWSTPAKIVWTIITYGLYGSVFTTILYTPTNAQLVNMTKDVKERSSIVGIREIFNNFGMFVVSAGFLPLVKVLGQGNEDRGFFLTTAFLAATAFVFQLWNLIIQKKYELYPDGRSKIVNEKLSEDSISFTKQLKRAAKNRFAVLVIIGTFVMNILMGVKSGFLLFMFEYCFMDKAFYSLAMVFFTMASITGAVCIAFCIRIFKDTNRAFLSVLILSMICNLIFFAMIKTMGYGGAARSIHFGPLFTVFMIGAFFQGIHYGMPMILLSNAIDYAEWKNRQSDIGILFGFNSLAMSLGSALGGTLVGGILALVKYEAGADIQAPEVLDGMLIGAVIIPAALTAVQFCLHLFYKFSDKEHEVCVRELAERKPAGSLSGKKEESM